MDRIGAVREVFHSLLSGVASVLAGPCGRERGRVPFALTFDDGPSPGTMRLLEELSRSVDLSFKGPLAGLG